MTKTKALKKYLKAMYDVDVDGMSVVSVLRNWLGVTGSTVSEVLNAAVDSQGGETTATLTYAIGVPEGGSFVAWPEGVEVPSAVSAVVGTEIELPTLAATGYTFRGWSGTQGEGGMETDDIITSFTWQLDEDITLYGYWTQ